MDIEKEKNPPSPRLRRVLKNVSKLKIWTFLGKEDRRMAVITAVEAKMIREVMRMRDPVKLHNLAEIVFNGVKDLKAGDDTAALTAISSLAGFIETRAVYLLFEKLWREVLEGRK